jgi:hypothetical protein
VFNYSAARRAKVTVANAVIAAESVVKFSRLVLPEWQAHRDRGIAMRLTRVVRLFAFGLVLCIAPAVLSSPSAAQIGIGISVRIGPPPLPVYEQPICPGEGYLWTPGYWAWDDDDGYYWVPGTWVEAPEPGLLWTPGYWGWNDGVYAWNAGYWGPQVGFYGGINYGFGYFGEGFGGGEWREGRFFYNTAVMRVDTVNIRNVYVNRTVIVNNESHVAFNGGEGGVRVRPTPEQETYMHERHVPPVAAQVQHVQEASKNRALFASNNHGRPAIAATAKPAEFSGRGVVAARAAGGTYHAPKMSPREARASAPAGNRAPANRASENRGAANHAATNHAATNRSAENRPAASNRPATKHATENRPAGNHASENRPAENNRPAGNRASENRPAENNRPASNGTRAANRPSTQPSKSHTSNRPTENTARENPSHSNATRPTESHTARPSAPTQTAHSNAPHTNTTPRAESRPSSAPRTESRPSSAPRAESRPAPAPHQSAPHESAPRASAPAPQRQSAPKPEHQSAPAPKRESAPPPKEHKG